MKKIIALALALVLALSLGSVAFAATTPTYDQTLDVANTPTQYDANNKEVGSKASFTTDPTIVVRPGDLIKLPDPTLAGWKIKSIDFTTGKLEGASLIESVKIAKAKDAIEIKVKESYTMALEEDKAVKGVITVKHSEYDDYKYAVEFVVNNDTSVELQGAKKAKDAEDYPINAKKNAVQTMDEDGGYVQFNVGELTGTVKMNKDEKVYFFVENKADDDTKDAIEEYLGEDFDAIVEYYQFETRAFKNEVAFEYDAYEDDDHFFYVWDGEKLVDLGAKYDDDEDVDNYVWTGTAEGTIVVTDKEIVAAAEEETKNPDTGANDVVGVAAALAVVSLVAAGAVALKK